VAAEQAGPKIGGRYRLDTVLGRGGMGTVWAGRDELLQRDVAVKEVVPPVGLDDPLRVQAGERTMREARAAARIHSRSAVTVYDVVDQDGRPWIVMELLSGRTLDDVLREEGPLPPDVVARIGLGVLDALTAAHEVGILHRDVKPGNVMFRDRHDLTSVVLSDFGIAHFDGDTALTQTGILLGSPAYLAPERAKGHVAGPASDLWALGVTLFTAVEGVSPFLRSGPLPSLNAVLTDDLPPYEFAGPLIPVLDGLLTRDPARRMDAVTAKVLLTDIAGTANPASATVPMSAPAAPTLAAPELYPPTSATTPAVPTPDAPVTATPVAPVPAALAGLREAPARSDAAPTAGAAAPPGSGGSGTAAIPAPRERASRGPRTILIGAAALVVTAALVAVPLILRSNSGSPEQQADRPGSASAATVKAKTCGPATSATPKGYYRVRNAGDFTVAVPASWKWKRSKGVIRLSAPGASTTLVVKPLDDVPSDPFPQVQKDAKAAADEIDGYKEVSLDALACDGNKAADWEYTSDDAHVLQRTLVYPGGSAFSLTWSTPDSSWDDDLETFTTIASTFAAR
jgi:hypothetical protein